MEIDAWVRYWSIDLQVDGGDGSTSLISDCLSSEIDFDDVFSDVTETFKSIVRSQRTDKHRN